MSNATADVEDTCSKCASIYAIGYIFLLLQMIHVGWGLFSEIEASSVDGSSCDPANNCKFYHHNSSKVRE